MWDAGYVTQEIMRQVLDAGHHVIQTFIVTTDVSTTMHPSNLLTEVQTYLQVYYSQEDD